MLDNMNKKTNISKIYACIVSYDEPDQLQKLIKSIYEQTLSGISVVVLDNSANANNVKRNRKIVRDYKWKSIYEKEQYNIGSAGGFSKCMSIAKFNGAKYVWLLDQDGFIKNDCLEKLLCHVDNNQTKKVYCPIVKEPNGKYSLINFRYRITLLGNCVGKKEPKEKASEFIVDGFGTHGILIPIEVIDEVGCYDNIHFFVGNEDLDYSYRLKINKYKIIVVLNAISFHPDLSKKHGYKGDRTGSWLSNIMPPFFGLPRKHDSGLRTDTVYSRSYIIGKYIPLLFSIVAMLYSSIRVFFILIKKGQIYAVKKTCISAYEGYIEGLRCKKHENK